MSLKKTRNANMDILRIISMFLIVFLHSIDHSGVLESVKQGTVMYHYVYFGYCLAQVCVNCFVLLSGYFMIESKFRPSKLVQLWIEVVFYSVVIRLIFFATGLKAFSFASLISCFIPVITGRYWFITIYFGMYLLSPFLNMAIKAMNKKQFTACNIILFVLFSVWSSIYPSIKGMNSGGGWGLAWFIVLYFFAAWIRLYYIPNKKIIAKTVVFFAIPVALTFALFISNRLGIDKLNHMVHNLYKYDSVFAIIMSLLLMLIFANINIKQGVFSKVAICVAPFTLGVYLIHAHADVSPWSWDVINLPQYLDKLFFPAVQIIAVIGIFLVCVIIDYLRSFVFKFIKLEKFSSWIDTRFNSFVGI